MMAPVLGIISYFAVNALVGEDPQAAEAGQSYKLVEKPNCRYASGLCGLKNVDFELTLSFELAGDDRWLLKLESVYRAWLQTCRSHQHATRNGRAHARGRIVAG